MIAPTTALRKIASLKKRIKVIQGGQGASKTFSILLILINHASSKANKDIFIVSHELSKMRITVIKDFVNILKLTGLYPLVRFTNGTFCRFPNGSMIKFIGMDKDDIGKGLRSDVIFVNEANKIKFEAYRELTSRAKNIYLDFNPNKKFWAHEEVITRPDADFIKLTYKDNEFLSKEETSEIERYKLLGYDLNGNIINDYWANKWRVYGLGLEGKIDGAVFQNWVEYSNDEDCSHLPFMFGIDWGFKDPFTLIKVHYDWKNKHLFVRELVYKSGLEPQGCLDVANDAIGENDKDRTTIADSANPSNKLMFLNDGWNIYGSKKETIIEGCQNLQNWKIFAHVDSVNLKNELLNYVYSDKDVERPIDEHNHILDPLRYIEREIRYEIIG